MIVERPPIGAGKAINGEIGLDDDIAKPVVTNRLPRSARGSAWSAHDA